MTTTNASMQIQDRHVVLSSILSVGAVLGILAALSFVATFPLTEGMSHTEIAGAAFNVPIGAIGTIACLTLAFCLLRWRTPLPTWALVAVAVALVIGGGDAWNMATERIVVARSLDLESYDAAFRETAGMYALLAPKVLLGFIGYLGLAIAGFRQGSIPRSAAALFGFAALLSLWPPYPPALLLGSIGLFIIARRGVPSRV